MKYNIYRIKNEKIQYLQELYKGKFTWTQKYASEFDYETALMLKAKLEEKQKQKNQKNPDKQETFEIVLCNSDEQFFKVETRFNKWRRKISEKDELLFSKMETLVPAIDLQYADEVLEAIVYATTETQIYMAMRRARERCA